MGNFKFNFLSRSQLEGLSLDKFLLTGFKTITCHEVFLVNYFLPLLLECHAEIILITLQPNAPIRAPPTWLQVVQANKPIPSPPNTFCHLIPTPSANFPSPQPSTVTKPNMVALYVNVHSAPKIRLHRRVVINKRGRGRNGGGGGRALLFPPIITSPDWRRFFARSSFCEKHEDYSLSAIFNFMSSTHLYQDLGNSTLKSPLNYRKHNQITTPENKRVKKVYNKKIFLLLVLTFSLEFLHTYILYYGSLIQGYSAVMQIKGKKT